MGFILFVLMVSFTGEVEQCAEPAVSLVPLFWDVHIDGSASVQKDDLVGGQRRKSLMRSQYKDILKEKAFKKIAHDLMSNPYTDN